MLSQLDFIFPSLMPGSVPGRKSMPELPFHFFPALKLSTRTITGSPRGSPVRHMGPLLDRSPGFFFSFTFFTVNPYIPFSETLFYRISFLTSVMQPCSTSPRFLHSDQAENLEGTLGKFVYAPHVDSINPLASKRFPLQPPFFAKCAGTYGLS